MLTEWKKLLTLDFDFTCRQMPKSGWANINCLCPDAYSFTQVRKEDVHVTLSRKYMFP